MDFPDLSWINPGTLSWAGLALIIVLSIMKGWLVPKNTHERELRGKDDQIAHLIDEKNEWKDAAKEAEKVAQQVRDQNRELLETAKTTSYALEAMRASLDRIAAEKRPPTDGDDTK